MSEFALTLIAECYDKKIPHLDLGKSGLKNEHFTEGSEVDKALRKCDHLESLILSNSWWDHKIQGFQESKNHNRENSSISIPPAIITLKKLKLFICAGRSREKKWATKNISYLTQSGGLTKLTYLDVSNNEIDNIDNISLLTNLKYLDLSNNQIEEISGFQTLVDLEHLDLGHNFIMEPKGLDNLKTLQFLHIGNNLLQYIQGLEQLTNLTELWLTDNQITSIQIADSLKKLQKLYLSNNRITTIEGLHNLTALQIFSIGHNTGLKTLDLHGLEALSELHASHSKLFEVQGLDDLISLQTADLSHNMLESVFPFLPFLQRTIAPLRLKTANTYDTNKGEIDLTNNPLSHPPVEIVQQGTKAVINYFKELEKQGTDYLYEAKMLIVGQPRAGKTSLRYKLSNSKTNLPEEDKTTRGIDIERIGFSITDKEGILREFVYNIWDFGGQQIYQTTHQFFLTHRSLYVLVMDTGKDAIGNDDATINYWLQAVELLGGNSPLLLVQNEKNERKINIDLSAKKARFPFLKDDYRVDLNALIPGTATYIEQREEDFKRLKEDIEKELTRLPHVGFAMPKNWVKIRQELESLSKIHPYIKLERYKAICNQFEVTSYERQMELSRIFHDLGVFLHFQDYGHLDDFIILQNIWATDAVFAVLDNEIVQSNHGRFTETDLQAIWESKAYDKEVHKRLLDLMMQFELCYQVDKTRPSVYIVPEMLPDSAPDGYSWQPANDLPLQYKYDFMPKGLLTRLIVRLHRHIQLENNTQCVWKTGVKIDGNTMDCPNTTAEITEAWDNKQLSIRIQGPFAKDLMSKITHDIDTLNKDFFKQIDSKAETSRSKWYKMIPCNCMTCKEKKDKHYYDYSKLIKRKEFGKDTIECEIEPFAEVNIEELLSGIFSKEKTTSENNTSTMPDNKKKLFISYSKDDLPLINKFIEHLSALQRDGVVAHWYCTALIAGTEWNKDIQDHFDQADIACFMVSPNFMRTQYIHDHEIKKAFDRKAKDPNFKIIPIILDFCRWTTTHNNLGQFTALPYTAKPVADFSNQNMAWYIIEECLRLMIEKDLNPTGEDFYTSQALPKDILRLLERIVAGKADA